MAQAPPILIYQPGGGVSSPIGSNPPVYSQADSTALVEGQAYIDVVFGSTQTNDEWVLVACEVENVIDSDPLNIWPGIISDRDASGFRLELNGMPDSGNYILRWAVSGINMTPVAATTYQLLGPTSGPLGEAATFTVKLFPSTTLATPVVVIPAEAGLETGVFSPTEVTLTTGSPSKTFTFTPAIYGEVEITVNNDGDLVNPDNIVFTGTAETYEFSGPSGGGIGDSTDFTVELPGGSTVDGTVTVTPSDGVDTGTFTPTSVELTTAAPSDTFIYTPVSSGAKTLSVTNDGDLTDPADLVYTVVDTGHLLDTLISYWKLDEASGSRVDTVGSNHLGTVGSVPAGVAGKINNACRFVAASSQYQACADNSSLRVTSDFTFSFWIRLTTQPGVAGYWIVTKDNTVIGRDYAIYYHPTVGFVFSVQDPVTIAVASVTVANSVWTHVVCWWDSADSKLRIRLNDATTYTSSMTGALIQTAAGFGIGAHVTAGPVQADFLDGDVDEVGFWKRLLTAGEITALYNSGSGLPYSSFTA